MTTDPAVQAAAEALRLWTPLHARAAEDAVAAARPHIAAEVRAEVAAAILRAGRKEVGFLSRTATDAIDRARLIGAEDAWKAAVRIAKGEQS